MEQHGSERERVQDRSKRPPRGINMAPRETQSVTLKKADFRETLLQGNMTQIDSQEMHQDGPRRSKDGPRESKEGPRPLQEAPKRDQHGSERDSKRHSKKGRCMEIQMLTTDNQC